MKKIFKIVKYLLLLILIFILTLGCFSTKWALDTFAFLNFDEIIFQLSSPIESASSTILDSFINDSLICSIAWTIIIYVVLVIFFKYISCKSFDININFFKKNINFIIKGVFIRAFVAIFSIVVSIGIIYTCLDKVTFIDYIKSQINDSSLIEDNYIFPEDVKLKFPEEKRNLIYIFVESFESSFFSSDLGGLGEDNYLAPLSNLTHENVNFSDTDKFGGAMAVAGTTWTSGAIVSHTTGLPLKIGPALLNTQNFSSMIDKAYSIGDILKDNGYNQMFMFGSDKNFGNRGIFLEEHGEYDVYDYFTAIEKGKISNDYYNWWGFEDSKLFEYAKEEITRLSQLDKPFNFSMLTVNTHSPDGLVEDDCPTLFDSMYANSIYCSSLQIANFINWIKNQDFYDNTTIVITGDHISMQEGIYPKENDDKRRIYNLFINSAISSDNYNNRQFTTMDLFPTTLASLGVEIDGEKLGLGTNLFSGKKTLLEEYGYDKFSDEIEKYSRFYMDEFVYK